MFRFCRTCYGQVVIPGAVASELARLAAPPAVRSLVESQPAWLSVAEAPRRDAELKDLGDGEAEAIVLAESLGADLLLCDDKEARGMARLRGVQVVGTLGVLKEASHRGLIDLSNALGKLQQTSFRVAGTLLESILEEDSSG